MLLCGNEEAWCQYERTWTHIYGLEGVDFAILFYSEDSEIFFSIRE